MIDDCNKCIYYFKLNYVLIFISALSIMPEFIKALDRRSKAFENLGRLDDALVGTLIVVELFI